MGGSGEQEAANYSRVRLTRGPRPRRRLRSMNTSDSQGHQVMIRTASAQIRKNGSAGPGQGQDSGLKR